MGGDNRRGGVSERSIEGLNHEQRTFVLYGRLSD